MSNMTKVLALAVSMAVAAPAAMALSVGHGGCDGLKDCRILDGKGPRGDDARFFGPGRGDNGRFLGDGPRRGDGPRMGNGPRRGDGPRMGDGPRRPRLGDGPRGPRFGEGPRRPRNGDGRRHGGGMDHTPSPVPLPAAGWMLIAGIGGLAAMRRKKKA